MLFRKKRNFDVAETVIEQQIENAEIIGDLLRKQYELMDSTLNISDNIFDIVDAQQRAIRDLQRNIMELQNLYNQEEEP